MAEAAANKPKEELKREAERIEEKTGGGQPPAQPNAPVVARPVRRYRALVFQGYAIGATGAFAVLLIVAHQVAYFTFDLSIERWVQTITLPDFSVLMQFVSGLGFNPLAPLLVALIVLFVWVVGLRWEAVMLFFAAAGISLLGALIKALVARHRPAADLVHVFSPLSSYSFPSGHVLLFTAFLGFLIFLVYTLTPHSWGRTLGLIIFGALIVLVGLSRIYLGQHWPSDVMGGYLLGSLWLFVTVYVYRWGKPRYFVNQPTAPA